MLPEYFQPTVDFFYLFYLFHTPARNCTSCQTRCGLCMSEDWQGGEEPVYMWKRDRLSTCVCNLIKLQRLRALLTTLGYVYYKLHFETSKARAILASCWPLQGDFMISPDQFFVCLDCFLCVVVFKCGLV